MSSGFDRLVAALVGQEGAVQATGMSLVAHLSGHVVLAGCFGHQPGFDPVTFLASGGSQAATEEQKVFCDVPAPLQDNSSDELKDAIQGVLDQF